MKKAILIAATAGLLLLCANPVAKAQEKAQSLGTQIIGTWKMVSGTYGGQPGGSPEITTLKHITPAHFLVVSYDKANKVTRVIGGPYVVEGALYKETPRYGFGSSFEAVRDQQQTFECKVEGDKFYQKGTLSVGVELEEVWERVKPEKKAP
jgi:hypothetical protein